ncbi:hypothetical protein Cmaq_0618 [Caldivirga maquilingensis IC-167]|uniref:Uncharacterized protein n=1 Tax=Caldivirga maquilingensis (strain ATCC 700844 / DSM 13496 / JCM 10307 / IC-167) TaxID=397948 RepID=A8MCF3_CALMQ|nr:hypothetical protein Cmaq_0618 [Caldivirga maquilingensis IC-167]
MLVANNKRGGCDPVSIRLEAEDFRLWYTKFRDVISDLSLVRRVSSIVYNLLNQGCSEEEVINAVEDILRNLNVNPLMIKRGEFQGLRGDVVEVLKVIFPNAVQETKPPFFISEEDDRSRSQQPLVTRQVRKTVRRTLRIRSIEMLSWIILGVSSITAVVSLVINNKLILGVSSSLALIFLIVALMAHIRMI